MLGMSQSQPAAAHEFERVPTRRVLKQGFHRRVTPGGEQQGGVWGSIRRKKRPRGGNREVTTRKFSRLMTKEALCVCAQHSQAPCLLSSLQARRFRFGGCP
jgi:hypothetical protein